jgi:hypothetical protein
MFRQLDARVAPGLQAFAQFSERQMMQFGHGSVGFTVDS